MSDELDEDQARFLGNVIGYSRSPGGGLRGEPEALTEAEQRALTEAARRRALEERIRTRQASAGEIARELEHIDARARYLRRQLRRLSRA
jgi:hypothetical protein